MSTLWQDGDWTVAAIDGPKRWLQTIENVTMGLNAFEQDYMQTVADWTATPLGDRNPDMPGFYLVNEGPLSPQGGGIVKWTRTYARIPDARTVYESYGWLVPGIGTEAVYADVNIASVTTGSGTTTLTTSTSSTAADGDSVSIAYTFTDSLTGTSYGRRVQRGCLSGTSGTTIVVDLISEPGGTITFQTLRKIEPGRAPETLEVQSQVQVDYWLPGVSAGVTTPLDIPVIAAMEIYDGDGRKANSFESDSTPTVATWRSQVATRALVCVVSSIVRPWLGPIYERRTRYCIAQ